jgi:predicted RNA binding protein YcfA (HicA-like mRNA interferase family)
MPQIDVYNFIKMGEIHTVKELTTLIENDGWYFFSQEGSHCHYKHAVKKGKVTVPRHNKDIKKGTANSILKQAGLK